MSDIISGVGVIGGKCLLEMAQDAAGSIGASTPEQHIEKVTKLFEAFKKLRDIEIGIAPEIQDSGVSQNVPAELLAEPHKSVRKNEVVCLICGKTFKSLALHLKKDHGISAKDYRKKFGLERTFSLTAKAVSEARRASAIERGLGEVLKKARETKAALKVAKKSAATKVQQKSADASKVQAKAPAKPSNSSNGTGTKTEKTE